MVKRFTVWMEEQFDKKRLMNILASRLGYDKKAIDNDVIMTDRKLSDVLTAIEQLPIDDDNKEQMINFAKSNHQSLSLKALANKINPVDIETQDKTTSMPAVLPAGTRPMPKPGVSYNSGTNQLGQGLQ